MNQTIMSTVQSLSGRHTGVFIVSDDPNIIRDSMKLTDAFKSVIGGDVSERTKSDGGGARKQ
ncbi:hypothetical protein QFZ77_002441 [Paenibacillus sp. V4I3]|nr:hypothetical protein [Paenibacillus sp. V4I3]